MREPHPPQPIDSDRVSIAGIHDVAKGGRSTALDHHVVDEFRRKWPDVVAAAGLHAGFSTRAVQFVSAELGIRQYIDIGCGKPAATGGNLHELISTARWMYVDTDPEVQALGHAILDTTATSFLGADARDVEVVIDQAAYKLVNLTRPVCVIFDNLWHYVPEDPAGFIRAYVDRLAPGSAVVLSHACSDGVPQELRDDLNRVFAPTLAGGFWPRPVEAIGEMLDGLEVLPPGIVSPEAWRPDVPGEHRASRLPVLAAVAVKR